MLDNSWFFYFRKTSVSNEILVRMDLSVKGMELITSLQQRSGSHITKVEAIEAVNSITNKLHTTFEERIINESGQILFYLKHKAELIIYYPKHIRKNRGM